MNALRARVYALRRKMARALAVLRIRRMADEFCLQWSIAVSYRRTPPPESRPFILRVVAAGFRLPNFMDVHRYLDRCRSENAVPETEDLLKAFLPWSWLYPPPRFD